MYNLVGSTSLGSSSVSLLGNINVVSMGFGDRIIVGLVLGEGICGISENL